MSRRTNAETQLRDELEDAMAFLCTVEKELHRARLEMRAGKLNAADARVEAAGARVHHAKWYIGDIWSRYCWEPYQRGGNDAE